MNLIKNFFCLSLIVITGVSCRAQSRVDSILAKKADSLDTVDINLLIKNGYISRSDGMLIGQYMVASTQKDSSFHNLTIAQVLDSVKAQKKKMNDVTASKYNLGKDSVFIRMPDGDKFFMGMGQLSFEKLVARESSDLPDHYDNSNYNLKINTAENTNIFAKLCAENKQSWLIGNVALLKGRNGDLKNLSIGDIFEISKRVAGSKEFAPFVDEMK